MRVPFLGRSPRPPTLALLALLALNRAPIRSRSPLLPAQFQAKKRAIGETKIGRGVLLNAARRRSQEHDVVHEDKRVAQLLPESSLDEDVIDPLLGAAEGKAEVSACMRLSKNEQERRKSGIPPLLPTHLTCPCHFSWSSVLSQFSFFSLGAAC